VTGTTSNPLVGCVIVNWNGWQDTIECLDALRAQSYAGLDVVVVDNGSTNDSVDQITAAHPWVLLHQTGKNHGFPTGCNVGTRIVYERGAELIWLLNNDTIAPPETLQRLVATALAHPEAGAIGSVLYYRHAPAQVQAWGGGKVNLWSGFVSHFHAPADFARQNTFFTGASLLLPRAVCVDVGVFFEGFFMYCDDCDLCLRIRRAGYPLVMAEKTSILHKEGGSSPSGNPKIDEFATTSTIRLLYRHARVPLFSVMLYLLLRITNRLVRFRWKNAASVWAGALVAWHQRDVRFSERL